MTRSSDGARGISVFLVVSCNRWEAAEGASEDGQLAAVGSLVLVVPWILHYAHLSVDECAHRTTEAIKLTHPAPSLLPFVQLYSRVLHSVLNGGHLEQVCLHAMSCCFDLFGFTSYFAVGMTRFLLSLPKKYT